MSISVYSILQYFLSISQRINVYIIIIFRFGRFEAISFARNTNNCSWFRWCLDFFCCVGDISERIYSAKLWSLCVADYFGGRRLIAKPFLLITQRQVVSSLLLC